MPVIMMIIIPVVVPIIIPVVMIIRVVPFIAVASITAQR
jgi:hypothetical protein